MIERSIAALIDAGGLPRLEARLLLEHTAGLSAAAIVAYPERELPTEQAQRYLDLCARRRAGEPIAYIVGAREFYGLMLAVTPDVLIPRPETELLVELALTIIRAGARRVLDLGTGSGAIAIAIARHAPEASVEASDVSSAALQLAQRNAACHGVAIRLRQSDWFNAFAAHERFDLILGNPPYIARDDPHLREGDVRFEPRSALVSGIDGLDAIRAIAAGAPRHLNEHGTLLLEHGYDQAMRVREILAAAGLRDAQSWRDLAAIERVSGARR